MKVIDIPINEIKPYENNPRHNEEAVDAVAESIKEFGFKVPIVVDENKTIICGHTRLLAALQLELEEIPCIIANDLTEGQIKAFRLADNKTGEIAEWDLEKLEQELQELTAFDVDMSLFGFDESIFETEAVADEDDFNVEEAVDEIIEPETKSGELFKLGNHFLLCGDSTKKEDVKKLMQGNTVNLFLTDPPYNVAVSNSEGMTIQNDDMSDSDFYEFLKMAFENSSEVMENGSAFYIWHADTEGYNFRKACTNAGLTLKQCLIWVKNQFIMGRQDYQWKHEPCLYGWKEGAAHYFIDDRTQSTVIEDKINIDKLKKEEMKELLKELLSDKIETTIIHEDKPLKNTDHPTMKPIKLMAKLITNSSRKKDIVLDLFGGSGSTLIACEQLNRQCFMMELDPKYCDVIIKRWEKLTGNKAEKIKK